MKRPRSIVLLSVALVLVPFTAARATQDGNPVKVRLAGEPRAAIAGSRFDAALRVEVGASVDVTDIEVGGEGWSLGSVETPNPGRMERGAAMEIPFTVVADDPSHPLLVTLSVDGQTRRRVLDVSERSIIISDESRVLRFDDQSPAFPTVTPPTHLMRSPKDRKEALQRGQVSGPHDVRHPEDPVTELHKARTIRIHGRIVYRRPDGQTTGAYGVTIDAWDEDSTWDEHLGSSVTDRDGYYDFDVRWDPCWACDATPDLYVSWEASNAALQVQSSTWEVNYSWESWTFHDFTGNDAYFQSLGPRDFDEHPALHICDRISRAWDQFHDVYGYSLPPIDVQWPDGNNAYYSWVFEEMHLSRNKQWSEGTIWHELGHHWMESFSHNQIPDYCNGTCDEDVPSDLIPDVFEDCGHCVWCEENPNDALNEGFPNFISWVLARDLDPVIPAGVYAGRDLEDLGACRDANGDICPCDPWETEGFISAFLQDLEDHTPGESHGVFGADLSDRLDGLRAEIFDVQDGYPLLGFLVFPSTPRTFIEGYRSLYPERTTDWRGEQFWETAANCGLDYDTTGPGIVPGIVSNTHPAEIEVTDASPVLRWGHATDDASGIDYYAWSIAARPEMPGTTSSAYLVRGDEVEVGPLAPGRYFFNIRARDRAGNYSNEYASYGPIAIRDFLAADIAFDRVSGWGGEVVPRPNPDAGANSCPLPTQLTTAPASTYWNIAGSNRGESSAPGFVNQILVDGVVQWQGNQASLAARESFQHRNQGPSAIRGGRHTVEARLDATGGISEIDEANNRTRRQWVWPATGVGPGVTLVRDVGPPAPGAGWEATGTLPAFPNCDGLSFQTTGRWDALVAWADDVDADVDLRLHNPSPDANRGFDEVRASSSRRRGLLDLVLVNGRTMGIATWDVGVIRGGDQGASYRATHVRSGTTAYDQPETIELGAGQMAVMRAFDAINTLGEWATIRLSGVTPGQTLHLAWFGPLFVLGSLEHAGAMATTDGSGVAEIRVFSSTNASNGVLVYRDPLDATPAVSFTLSVVKTPADFATGTPAGWHSPLVPRPVHLDSPGAVALPDTLYGGGPLGPYSYLSLMIANEGPVNALSVRSGVSIDGKRLGVDYAWPLVFGGSQYVANWDQRISIRPGRHTLTLAQDPDDGFVEISESNNRYAEQYVWGAWVQPIGSPGYVSTPPDRFGGWLDMPFAAPRWYNCIGYRTPTFTPTQTYWGGFAVIPRDTTDVDVRLHEVTAGTKDAFSSNLAHSTWGRGQSDFVLANFNATAHRAFDVGVVNFGGGQAFQFESVAAAYRGDATAGSVAGPFTMPTLRILDLHEFYLREGYYTVSLVNIAGTVDWGFSIHGPEKSYHAKGSALLGGMSWLAPAGVSEVNTVYIPTGGFHCIAVWKSADADRLLEGSYRIEIESGVTAAPPVPTPPLSTRLTAIHPNPFNPRLIIGFDVARPSRIEVKIYSMRGELVRDLADEQFESGRYERIWDGTDDGGRDVASGVYLVRLGNGGVVDQRKVTLVR